MVQVAHGRSLYVDWKKAQPGKETVILLNGLTYETSSWDAFVEHLSPLGFGILRYDPKGMGKTLAADGPVQDQINIEDQARDLNLLTRKLGLTGKLNLLGLSYGGGLAIVFGGLYPERTNKVILMSPYSEPLASEDLLIRSEIAGNRMTFPFNPATDEELYAYFLRQIIYFVDPIAEPSILSSPLKPEAVFQMTQGIRKYDILGASKNLPQDSVHLMVAGQDQYIPRPVLQKFWDQLPLGSQASRVLIDFSEHKIPEAFPEFAAKWVGGILNDLSDLQGGQCYEADPISGKINLSPGDL